MAKKSNVQVQSEKTEEQVVVNPVVEEQASVEPTEVKTESNEPVVVPTDEDVEKARIEKENKVVDLESEIVKLSERLADLKKELRSLTKPASKKEGPTKMELAKNYYYGNPGKARKDYVQAFMSELGMTNAGAKTYIQIIMTKEKQG